MRNGSGIRNNSKNNNDELMSDNRSKPMQQRTGSANRRALAAAAYQANGPNRQVAGASGSGNRNSSKGRGMNNFEYTDSLMEQLGTPEMLI